MIRTPIPPAARIALAIASLLVVAGIYSLLSIRQHRINPKDTTIPNLSQLVEGGRKIITPDSARDVWLLEDSKASLVRLFAGLGVGIALAFVVGMAMGCFVHAEAFFVPPISFLAKIPPTAMLAVYLVVLRSTGLRLFVALIALGIFPTLAQAIHQAAKKDVTDHAIYKAYTLGASHFEVIFEVVFRQILPRIIENIRLQIGPAMVFLIAAEWMLADVGFGYRLRIQSRLLNMNVVYIYLFILAAFGFVLDGLLSLVRRKLCPWFGD